MNDVPTVVCPGCAIKNDEGFTIYNCMNCPSQTQNIITKIIKDQRSNDKTNEYDKV